MRGYFNAVTSSHSHQNKASDIVHLCDYFKGYDQRNEKMEHENNCNTPRYECHFCK